MSTPIEIQNRTTSPAPWNHDLDALLERFGREEDDRKANQILDDIFRRHGAEAIRRSVERALGRTRAAAFEDADDLIGEVSLNLVERLRRWRDNRGSKVDSFQAYTESVARNAVHNRMQKEQPLRSKLIANLRYAVASSPRLCSWRNRNGITVIGLSESGRSESSGSELLSRLLEDPRNLALVLGMSDGRIMSNLRSILTGLIEVLGHPVPFYTAVNLIASARELADGRPMAESQFEVGLIDRMIDTAQSAEVSAIVQEELLTLWLAIRELPPLQRAALLLNLRDSLGRGVIALLLETRIASLSEIARAVAMPEAELVERWDSLPLDDRSIAARYGITPVQVVSHRRNARARLRKEGAHTMVLKPSRSRAAA